MQLQLLKPKQSLNKAYLKEKLSRAAIDQFKQNFKVFLDNTSSNKGDEEHLKSQVAYFLRDTWFKELHHINPIGKNDLVIHTGKNTTDPAGVIIEVKSITNKTEMLSAERPNAKALHELVLYYLRQRIDEKNNELKYLVATNINEWFIFDANEFDKKIFRNTAVKKLYDLKKSDNKDNPWFYDELKKLLGQQADLKLEVTAFNLRDFGQVILNADQKDDHKLIAIYKILSPVHLLKLPFANDSNSLQPKFYAELLHIIGLTEIKEGSKKLIQRKKEGERNNGSLLENTIIALDTHDKISRLNKPSAYGDTYPDRLFNAGLELVITWVNRILFLKLLEAQLAGYHKGDPSFRFLNKDKIKDFDDLDKLFFSVLAKKPNERRADIQQLFGNVPYLNSSLFEPTELEHQTLFIHGLEDRVHLPLIPATVLKNEAGKSLKTSLDTIDYLFAFLDAYDFSSEGAEEIQEDNKTLINASVLGLIFEKINGYKDGSFFTPGFITMYMCRETIRKAFIQKMNERIINSGHHNWVNMTTIAEVYNQIGERVSKNSVNEVINNLKICDPAVGSGHFLVSALNEMIALKSELKVLQDKDGKLLRDYQVEVVNDELIVTDEDGKLFEYNPNNKESQRVQETLFYEKQTLIENCLFGVDINPNSVKICRLRLWIELLKNAYYRPHPTEAPLSFGDGPGVRLLETLPNIDINIKTGNSLISRFALDADLKQALKKSGHSIEVYKIAVQTYRDTKDKAEKQEMQRLINAIKTNFKTEIANYTDPLKIRISKLGEELFLLTGKGRGSYGMMLFEEAAEYNSKNTAAKKLRIEKIEQEISKLNAELEERKNNKIYDNAFEWRFEFPEVLNDDGGFIGFDVVIGNPPYISIQELKMQDPKSLDYYKLNYQTASQGNFDIYIPFLELLSQISNSGTYIIPSKFFTTDYGKSIREFLINKQLISRIIDFGHNIVFDSATVYTCILFLEKENNDWIEYIKTDPEVIVHNELHFERFLLNDLKEKTWTFSNSITSELLDKINLTSNKLIDLPTLISRGSSTGDDKIFVLKNANGKLINGYGDTVEIENEILIKPIYATDFTRYLFKGVTDNFLIFPYNSKKGIYTIYDEDDLKTRFPLAHAYFQNNRDKLERRKQYNCWYAFSAARSLKSHSTSDILVPLLANRGLFCLTPVDDFYTLMAGGGFSISIKNNNVNAKYLLALLNSKLLFFLLYRESNKFRGGYITCTKQYFENLPIKIISIFEQEPFIKLVNKILLSHSHSEKNLIEKEIDQLVYQLYGLTEEEIKIVEGGLI